MTIRSLRWQTGVKKSATFTNTCSERIYLPPQVTLLFEVPDLSAASPATVSRCGMIYMSVDALGWKPYVESWIDRKPEKDVQGEILHRLFDKFVQKALDFKKEKCTGSQFAILF
jgi:dynein heavy chain